MLINQFRYLADLRIISSGRRIEAALTTESIGIGSRKGRPRRCRPIDYWRNFGELTSRQTAALGLSVDRKDASRSGSCSWRSRLGRLPRSQPLRITPIVVGAQQRIRTVRWRVPRVETIFMGLL